jgi:hypothetical protein
MKNSVYNSIVILMTRNSTALVQNKLFREMIKYYVFNTHNYMSTQCVMVIFFR